MLQPFLPLKDKRAHPENPYCLSNTAATDGSPALGDPAFVVSLLHFFRIG